MFPADQRVRLPARPGLARWFIRLWVWVANRAAWPGTLESLAILLLEPDTRLGELAARRLRLAGHQVTLVATAQAAWQAMGMRRLDLACLPRELPTTLRGALVRSLRTRHPGCFIVLLGSASQPITVAASSITEIDAFLPRPWKRSEMLAVLAACQARRAVHEPGSQNRVS